MAPPTIDSVPETSYSDPIYDRLEALSSRVRRARWVIFAAIVVAIAIGVGLRAMFNNRPDAVSAVAFIDAGEADTAELRHAAWKALVEDAKITPFFRAKAALELCQESLTANKPAEAKGWAAKATSDAAMAKDDELSLAARLSEGAVAEDSGELDAALGHYEKVQSAAGTRFLNHYLLGVYGAARVEKAQKKFKEAIERLDPVVTRTDDAAKRLLPLLHEVYWACKREVDGGPTITAEPKKVEGEKPISLLPENMPPIQLPIPAEVVPKIITSDSTVAPVPAPAAK